MFHDNLRRMGWQLCAQNSGVIVIAIVKLRVIVIFIGIVLVVILLRDFFPLVMANVWLPRSHRA